MTETDCEESRSHPMQVTDDLVERLRRAAAVGEASGSKTAYVLASALTEAADRIERLQSEVERLREVLKPFVDLGAQTGASGVINKNLDGLAPLTVTVTKAQMLAALRARANQESTHDQG